MSTFSVARALVLELSTVIIFPLGVFSLRGCGKQRQQLAAWHLTSPGSPLSCPCCGSGRGTESHVPLVPWPNFCLFLRTQPNSNLCFSFQIQVSPSDEKRKEEWTTVTKLPSSHVEKINTFPSKSFCCRVVSPCGWKPLAEMPPLYLRELRLLCVRKS